jgi:hypothetical protein
MGHHRLTPMPLERVVEVLGSRGNDLTRILGAGWLLDNPLRVETLGPPNMLLRDEERAGLRFQPNCGSVSFDPLKPDWIDHRECGSNTLRVLPTSSSGRPVQGKQGIGLPHG